MKFHTVLPQVEVSKTPTLYHISSPHYSIKLLHCKYLAKSKGQRMGNADLWEEKNF